ncbi:MAG: hypothetical protein GY838_00270 [bacterium]|nr:hypothetical protein [bacterium]
MLEFEGRPKFLTDYALVGFDLTQSLGSIGELEIVLHPRAVTAAPPMKAFGSVQESLGQEVKCKLGDWRFNGRVASVAYDHASQGFRITLHDELSGLAAGIGSAVFAEQSLKDIVGAAAAGCKVTYIGGLETTTVKLAIQYQESPLTFLRRLLAEYGGQIWCDGKEVLVGSGPHKKSLNFKLEKDITDFRIVSQLGPENVQLESIPYSNSNRKTSEVELGSGSHGKLQDAAVDLRAKGSDAALSFHTIHENADYEEAKHHGRSFLRSRALGRFWLMGSCTRPVRLGAELKIAGIGSGAGTETTLVRSVGCHWDSSTTEPGWFFEAANPEAVLAPEDRRPDVLRLSTAEVDQTDDDLNRVAVKFPWDPHQTSTPWLRIAAPSWGEGHMHYLPPKVGDTVLVLWGFGDMDPIVMGSVAAGARVDQPDANLVLRTPDGQSIVIDKSNIELKNDQVKISMDKSVVLVDTGGSKINLDSNNIELSTGGKIKIDGKGGVEITGVGGIALKTPKLDVG